MTNPNPNTAGLKQNTQKARTVTNIYQHYALKGRIRRRRTSANNRRDPFRWVLGYEEYMMASSK